MAGAAIEFEFTNPADEDWFVREYLAPSWAAFEERDEFDFGWFWRSGNHGTYDIDGHADDWWVHIVIEGDPAAFVERERDIWARFEYEDLLASWNVRRYADEGFDSLLAHQREVKGDVGGERYVALKVATTRMTVRLLQDLDEQLPVIGTSTAANPAPINFWVVIHLSMLQNGYDWYDEIAACSRAIKNRCWSLAANRSAADARDALDDVLDDLSEFADELPQDE